MMLVRQDERDATKSISGFYKPQEPTPERIPSGAASGEAIS